MLPVNMHNGIWFDNSALQILKFVNLIMWPKHFVTALILNLNTLIYILTSLAVSTAALVSKIKTVNFINNLNKNVLFALAEQLTLNKKLKTKENTLKKCFWLLVKRNKI